MTEGEIQREHEFLTDEETMQATFNMRAKLDAGGMKTVNRQTMIGIADRLIALAKEGHPTMAEGFMEVDTGIYTDPALYEAEKRAIFDRFPFVAGLSRDVEKPGDYLNIDDFGTPLLITRNKDGQGQGLRQFLPPSRRGAGL